MTRCIFFNKIVIFVYVFVAIAQAENIITVEQSGNGHYRKIQDAIDSVAPNNTESVTILVKPGIYKESISVPADKPRITICGSTGNASDVIVTWDQRGDIDKVATVHVRASDFVGRYMTIQNTYGPGHQAVALRVSGDRAAFYECSIVGNQDTLFDEIGRHYYQNCYIEGAVDFIFGSSASLFETCHIHSVGKGYITAQRREIPTENGGFVFFECGISGQGTTLLGRPWDGVYARVIFAYTYMEDVIEPQGWGHSNGLREEDLRAKTLCGQYRCDGPGATTSNRVKWAREFTDQQVAPYLTIQFINGEDWIKSTPTTISPPAAMPSSPQPMKKKTPLPPPAPVIPSLPPPAPMARPIVRGYEEGQPIIMYYSSGMFMTSFSCIGSFALSSAVLLYLLA